MAIKAITQQQFDRYSPARTPMIQMIAEEKAWFSDDAMNIIGTILFDKSDMDWNWVMLGRDPKGSFRAIDTEASFKTQEEAEKSLKAAMSKVEASGESVFEQD